MPSPFVYTVLFLVIFCFCNGQFNTENWLHPFQYDTAPLDTGSYIQIHNNTHIGLIQFDDSLNLYQLTFTIKGQKNFASGLVYFNHNNFQSIIDYSQTDYGLSFHNRYFKTGVGYIIQKEKLTAALGITGYSNLKGISPSFSLGIEFFPWLKGKAGRELSQKPFNLNMHYSDFDYILESTFTEHDITNYEFEVSSKLGEIKYGFRDDDWKVSGDNSIQSELDFEIGVSRTQTLRGELLFSKKQKIILDVSNQFDITKFDLLNNTKHSFFKVNKFSSENYKITINYQFHSLGNIWNLGLLQQRLTLLMSNRIRPSRVSTDFESFYNSAAILNNKNTGELIQRGVSLNLHPEIEKTIIPNFQFDWISDSYDINLITNSLSLLGGIPDFYDDQELNIIRKDAIILSSGFNLKQNKWGLQMDFSQHIPYNIKVREVYPHKPVDDKTGSYGGGLFHFTLTRFLD